MAYILRKKLLSLGKTILQSTHIPTRNPNLTLFTSNSLAATPSTKRFLTSSPNFRARNDVDHSNKHSDAQCSSAHPGLVGWWVGISEEAKYPYGQIIHISAEQGRYLARSYSPWQLATAKDGTPVFEIYVTTNLEGEYKEQAIYIKHKAACPKSLESSRIMKLEWDVFPLTRPGRKTDQATGTAVDSLEVKSVIHICFDVGDIGEKVTGTHYDKVLRVPATLERKDCFSFCLTLETEKDQHVSVDDNHEVYRTTDYSFLDFADCIGRGIPVKVAVREDDQRKFISLLLSWAKNQQPVLSRLTTFNRIDIPASPDPLNGLYIGSNGYLATEVIQLRKLFGPWHEVGDIKDVSEPELCEYVEAVNLTGDFDIPAGQVAFRVKVGEKYKLCPGDVLEEVIGAAVLYKGRGRHPGFQNSEWVDVEVLIIGEERAGKLLSMQSCRDGFAIAVLYSAAEYHLLKFFKQLKLQSFQESP